MPDDSSSLPRMVAEITAAYLSSAQVQPGAVPDIIKEVAAALRGLGQEPPAEAEQLEKPSAARIRRSVTPDAIISFEDGRPYRMIMRHLAGRGLTPAEYRAKWGLPSDYPMIAPSYSAARSEMAKKIGLGAKSGKGKVKSGGRARAKK